jgi:hypothetical protein
MSEDYRARLKQMLDSGEIRLEPLTLPQRELWETAPRPVADVSNHICAFIEVRGKISPANCEAALQRVVDRQEVLRLSFLPMKESAIQMIRASGKPVFEHRELQPGEDVEAVMREIFLRPFDMLAGPLFRVVMLQKSAKELVLVFAVHHTIADGWTLGVFVQDLCTAYLDIIRGSKKPLPPVPMSYGDWGKADRGAWTAAELEPRLTWWKNHLAEAPRLWSPTVTEKPVGPLRRHATEIPAKTTEAVKKVAKKAGATLFSTLLTAFQSALAQWTGVLDIVVGTPVANRAKKAAHETMGYFAGVVPLRGRVDPAVPLAQRIQAVHEETVECFSNAVPFVELAKALGHVPGVVRNPLFDVRFALQNHPVPDVALPGLSVKLRMRSTGTARFDLGCELTEDGKALELIWLHDPAVIPPERLLELDAIFKGELEKLPGTSGMRAAA